MIVLDTEFIIAYLLGPDFEVTLLEKGIFQDDATILSATIAQVAIYLEEQLLPRDEIAKLLIRFVSRLDVEDATLHIHACFVYEQTRLSYADCLSLAYAHQDGVEPLFENEALQDALESKRFDYAFFRQSRD